MNEGDWHKSKMIMMTSTRPSPFCFILPFSLSTFQFLSTQLLKEINRTSISHALRIRRQAGQSDPKAYVTAHFKTLPLEFTLGDGRNYGDFRNRPLQNGQEYVFFVLALLDLSENVSKHTHTHTHTQTYVIHLNALLSNLYVETMSSCRPCLPLALILTPSPHWMWTQSQ